MNVKSFLDSLEAGGTTNLTPTQGNAPASAAPDLLRALKHLRAEIRRHFKLDVRKHSSLMIADAAAGTAIYRAEGGK